MRRNGGLVIALTFVALGASADDHLEHLKMMIHEMASHGPIIPQPESLTIDPQATKTIAISAHATPSFGFTPSSFTVNQGDVVTISLSVAANDGSQVNNPAHALLMDTYVEQQLNCTKGQTVTRTFTATTPGTFPFVCAQSNCGIGHSSMFGQMVVNAVVALSVSGVSPSTGSTAGGTDITLTGSAFQTGATVTIGGVPATNVNVVSSTSITAKTPLGPASEQATQPRDVVVTNPDGTTATLTRGFSYFVPALAITSINPTTGPVSGGTVVTIAGLGFTTAVNSSVTFGGVAATNVTILDAVTMQATTPAHAVGTVDMVVTFGTSVTRPNAFTYQTIPPRHRSAKH
ncbi:MAG TPA: IPT/TIG domain-containing protein [Thermoanaerobaculia bacterium]|nr:IPT/TIG domain-containing protein [Thermoanaerobaculia bacterium]